MDFFQALQLAAAIMPPLSAIFLLVISIQLKSYFASRDSVEDHEKRLRLVEEALIRSEESERRFLRLENSANNLEIRLRQLEVYGYKNKSYSIQNEQQPETN